MPTYKSILHEMTQTTPTCLWNDSAALSELTYSMEHGGVGATCNPVIVLDVLKQEMAIWKDRILGLTREMPEATESQIGWRLVEEISAARAALLKRFSTLSEAGMAVSPFRPTLICIVIRTR